MATFGKFWLLSILTSGHTGLDPVGTYEHEGKTSEGKGFIIRALVVAQLVEHSLPMPEVRSVNPAIGKLFYQTLICLLSTVLKRLKIKKKRGHEWPIFKKDLIMELLCRY